MIVVSRTLALITVALAVLAVTHFSATPQSGQPGPPRIETLAYASGLPEDWASSVVPSLRGLRPFATDGEVREVVRLVDRCAEDVGVDPLLVLSVIQVESRFDRNAVSARGAIGLMQLRPDTAQAIAAGLGMEWTSEEVLFDPATNVLLGTLYLKELVDRFGDIDAALAAFHAGPTRIESRLARSAGYSLRYVDQVWRVLFRLQAGALA